MNGQEGQGCAPVEPKGCCHHMNPARSSGAVPELSFHMAIIKYSAGTCGGAGLPRCPPALSRCRSGRSSAAASSVLGRPLAVRSPGTPSPQARPPSTSLLLTVTPGTWAAAACPASQCIPAPYPQFCPQALWPSAPPCPLPSGEVSDPLLLWGGRLSPHERPAPPCLGSAGQLLRPPGCPGPPKPRASSWELILGRRAPGLPSTLHLKAVSPCFRRRSTTGSSRHPKPPRPWET